MCEGQLKKNSFKSFVYQNPEYRMFKATTIEIVQKMLTDYEGEKKKVQKNYLIYKDPK